jgi:hypothetical protein
MSHDLIGALERVRPAQLPEPEATAQARRAALAAFHEAHGSRRAASARSRPVLDLRRSRLALVVLGLALLGAAPALALFGGVLDFEDADVASPAVQQRFGDLFVSGAPPRMDPRVQPMSTRKVRDYDLPDGRHTLWVAPTAGGGFCALFTDFTGGCIASRTAPVPRMTSATEINPWRVNTTAAFIHPGPPGPTTIGGHVLVPFPATLELVYEDGDTEPIPLTFVSKPIDAGFFLFAIPQKHRAQGHLPARLVLRDHRGDVVAQTEEQVNPPAGPRGAG